MKKEIREELAEILEEGITEREEIINRLSSLLNDEQSKKLIQLVQAYLDNPETFREIFNEDDIRSILSELL